MINQYGIETYQEYWYDQLSKYGYDIFEKVIFVCEEEMAYELTAMTINHIKAIGMYRVPSENSHLFIAIMEQKQIY